MDTNPTPEVTDEGSIDDRLSAIFDGPEDDAEASPADTPEAPDEGPDEAAAQPEAAGEDDSEEVEFEGKAYKVPKELKPALLRQADYTTKTQEVATLRKQAEDRIQFSEAQQQLFASLRTEALEFETLKARKAEYDKLDWSALYSADPGQAFNLRQQADGLKEQLADKERVLSEKAGQHQAIQKAHAEKQWSLAVEAARQRIGKFTPAEDIAMAQQAQSMGFDESELKSKFADARVLHLLHKAAKWDALQQGKTIADKKVTTARPMKTASRSAPEAQRDGKLADVRERLRKTGRDEYAEAYFNARFK
jgi:hypothetical protein